MKLYANCNRMFNRDEIHLKNAADEILFSVKHVFLKKKTGLKVYNEKHHEAYKINYEPLRTQNNYTITDTHNHPIVRIHVGKKLIHSIEYDKKDYICKGSFLKMKYRLYDGDNEIALIRVIKKDKLKYFEITYDEKRNIIFALMMLIIAQTIKDCVWNIYKF